MLAGPRKRQKISADPRNKQWIKDPNQFGRRLMEKMGWSDGKGLGMKEDGDRDFVKVSLKGNTKGLGFNHNEEENWISHQDDFNDLLSQLHQEHSSQEEVVSQAPPSSIEEKSKNSRKRVHYKKFTRGKDLTNRSVDDMNCILGRRSGSSTPQNLSAPTSDNESDNHGVSTITNNISVQDYFAQKMQKLKGSKAKDSEPDKDSTNQEDDEEDDDGLKKRKSKKKKKKSKIKETGDGETLRSDDEYVKDGSLVGFVGFNNTDTSHADATEEQSKADGEEKLFRTDWEGIHDDGGGKIYDTDISEMKKKKKKRKKKRKDN